MATTINLSKNEQTDMAVDFIDLVAKCELDYGSKLKKIINYFRINKTFRKFTKLAKSDSYKAKDILNMIVLADSAQKLGLIDEERLKSNKIRFKLNKYINGTNTIYTAMISVELDRTVGPIYLTYKPEYNGPDKFTIIEMESTNNDKKETCWTSNLRTDLRREEANNPIDSSYFFGYRFIALAIINNIHDCLERRYVSNGSNN